MVEEAMSAHAAHIPDMTQNHESDPVVDKADDELKDYPWTNQSEAVTEHTLHDRSKIDINSDIQRADEGVVESLTDDEDLIDHGGYTEDPRLLARRRAWFEAYCTQMNSGPAELPLRCPCCYQETLEERCGYEICEICHWEDDGQDDHNADLVLGGPNGGHSLTEARAMFRKHAADSSDNIKMLSFQCQQSLRPGAGFIDGRNSLLDEANEDATAHVSGSLT